jgi:hypothetical protein
MADPIDRTPFEIPYLKNIADSEFYTQVREVIERRMPLEMGKTVECNLQKPGGYELAVDVFIKPGEVFQSDREYRDYTRFPARIRAAATVLRDLGNFGRYSIRHRQSILTINQIRDDFAPTADPAELERRTKQLLAIGTLRKPAGVVRPAKVQVTQSNFVRDPRVRAYGYRRGAL